MSRTPIQLISQLNLWFKGWPEYNNYILNGRYMVPFEPLLGYTDSFDGNAMLQQMQWVSRYSGGSGENFIYSLEWIKPEFEGNEFVDAVIDRNLRTTFLPALEHTNSRWHIFYDSILAPVQRLLADGGPIDYSRADVFRMFVRDLDYLEQYFQHPAYWRIDGRPVLYFWAVPDGMVNAENAFAEARRRGIYLLGDTFGRSGPVPPLDGHTGFVAWTPEIEQVSREWELREVFPYFERYYQGPPGGDVDVIPAMSCQHDSTEFREALGDGGTAVRILARDRSDVEAFLKLADSHSQPIHGERYLFCGTLDNWAEGATILPTEVREPRFWDHRGGLRRIGYYQFEHLEAIRRTLYPEVAEYTGPRLTFDRDRLLFEHCDLMGELRLTGPGMARLRNVPEWSSGRNLEQRPGFRRTWTPRLRRGDGPKRLRVEFRNLDGRTGVEVIR